MKLYAKLLRLGKGNKKIEWIIPYVKGLRVLDLGCAGEGEGAYLRDNWLHARLVAAADSCVGLDHNEEAIKNIKSRGYNAVSGDAQDFISEQSFDVVVAADVLEHLHDFKGFFASLRQCLKEDGRLIITTPNPWFFLRFMRCIVKRDGGVNPDHVVWFCAGSIRELLNRYGFDIEELQFGSSEPIFYKLGFFSPVLFHTSLFVAARKKPIYSPG
jgi:SAM-dependent methyltransferase